MLLLRKDAHVVVWVRWWASELTIGVVVALSREIRFGFSLLTWKLKSPAVMATDLVDGSLLASWVYLLRAVMTLLVSALSSCTWRLLIYILPTWNCSVSVAARPATCTSRVGSLTNCSKMSRLMKKPMPPEAEDAEQLYAT